jgi:hypothetical protein
MKIAPKFASKPTMTATATSPSSPPHPPPQQPTPTPTLTGEPTWLTGPALKAANEHTYATQRAKKAADRAKGKLPPRKAPSSAGSVSLSSSSAQSRGAAAITSFWAEVWDARKMMSAEDLDWPELPTPSPLSKWAPSPTPASPTEYAAPLRPTQDREVPLSALVRPVKARGAKAKAKGACLTCALKKA